MKEDICFLKLMSNFTQRFSPDFGACYYHSYFDRSKTRYNFHPYKEASMGYRMI
jgi:hypothetical protein